MGNAWSIAIDTICSALESDTRGTFLAQPGKVAQLPPDVAAIRRAQTKGQAQP